MKMNSLLNPKQMMFALLLGVSVGFASCNQEEEDQTVVSAGNRLSVSYEVQDVRGVVTRATNATDAEREVTHVYALFFDHHSSDQGGFRGVTRKSVASGSGSTIAFDLPSGATAAESFDVLFVGNMDGYSGGQTDVKAWLETVFAGKKFENINELVATAGNGLNTCPLLMWGVMKNTLSNSNQTVKLYRSLARADLKVELLDNSLSFTLTEAYLYNASKQMIVTEEAEKLAGTEHQNQPDKLDVTAKIDAATQTSITESVYLFPRETEGIGDKKNTCLIIRGKMGTEDYGYYRINICDTKNKIQSNYLYGIKITEINGKGYTTIDDALINDPLNIRTDTEGAWDNEDLVVGNGTYWMRVSPSVMNLYTDKTSASVLITDNLPAGKDNLTTVVLQGTNADKFTFTEESEDKVTVQLKSGVTADAVAQLKLVKMGMEIVVNIKYQHTVNPEGWITDDPDYKDATGKYMLAARDIPGLMDYNQAVAACNNLGTRWFLPTIEQVEPFLTSVNAQKNRGWLNFYYQTGTEDGFKVLYWSSTQGFMGSYPSDEDQGIYGMKNDTSNGYAYSFYKAIKFDGGDSWKSTDADMYQHRVRCAMLLD